MRILVTGSSGYIGGRIVQYLNSKNYQLRCASRSNQPSSDNIESIILDWDSMEDLVDACCDVDIIVHASGMNAQESSNNVEGAYLVNAIYTARLIKAAIQQKVARIIYFSTAHVYSSPLVGEISEATCTKSLHPYAASHKAAEDIIRYEVERNNIEGIIFRLTNSFGSPVSKDANCWMLFMNDICRQAISSGTITIRSGASSKRDFIPLTEVCRITESFFRIPYEKLAGNIINIGAGQSISLLEMAKLVAERMKILSGSEIEILTSSSNTNPEPLVIHTQKLNDLELTFDWQLSANKEVDQLISFCLSAFNR